MQHYPANKMHRLRQHSNFQREPGILGLPINISPLPIPILNNVLSLVGNNPAPSSTGPAAATTTTPSGGQFSLGPPGGGSPSGNPVSTPSAGGSIPSISGLPGGSGSSPLPLPRSSGNGLGSSSLPSSTGPSIGATPVVNVGGPPNLSSVPSSISYVNSNPGSSSLGSLTTVGPIPSYYTSIGTGSGGTTIIAGSAGGGGGTVNGAGPDVSNATSKPGISSGAIAGIILALVAVLGFFIVIFVRRQYQARRNQRREKWLAYGNTPGANSLPRSGFSSTRSSFASPDIDNALNTQSLYMHEHAQLSEKHDPVTMSEIAAPPIAVVVEHTGGVNNRNSVYSIGSDSSGGHSDSSYVYLSAVSAVSGVTQPLPSPISVRPFTPSESWSFPKPPISQATTPIEVKGDSTDEHGNFASVETIMRPFIPSMSDELSVEPGDFIRVVKTFDDGWALVEKFESTGGTVTGLIPVDCLRPSDEQARSPSASKRFSSYGNSLQVPKIL